MKRLAPALLLLAACNADNLDVATTGPTTTTEAVSEPPALWVHSFPTTTTTPRVAAPAPAQARSGDCGGWRDLIARHFPAEVVEDAVAVCECESHGDPSAHSRTNDRGLFQIHWPIWADTFAEVTGTADGFDPEANVAFAAWLWSREGWRPWACRWAAA